jgi:hypothetical protein
VANQPSPSQRTMPLAGFSARTAPLWPLITTS